jgi:cytochrome c biogenesis protein CcmG/thiol:disulfide interchange protein DsbE
MQHASPTVRIALLPLLAAGALGVATATSAAAHQRGTPPASSADAQDPPRAWLDRLDREDRAALDTLVGFEAPALPAGAAWILPAGTASPPPVAELRGKVIVVQSFSTRGSGRRSVDLLQRALADTPRADLEVLLVHTPEQADRAAMVLERQPVAWPCLVDERGETCDRLGFFKRPTNLVIDRQGNVRYAGLTPEGAAAAVAKLSAEPYDPATPPTTRPAPRVAEAPEFPRFTEPVGSARDLRGQAAPEFVVDRWITDADAPRGRLLLVDFWATWCGPCIAALPQMKQIADRYRDDVCVIGLSSESKSDFDEGMRKRNLKEREFNYALALDPQRRFQSAFAVRGIPHVVIVSGDGVVRWQGHPSRLDNRTLEQLIAANRGGQAAGPGESQSGPPARWSRSRRS